jgi:glutaminyl-tRNA synthetase
MRRDVDTTRISDRGSAAPDADERTQGLDFIRAKIAEDNATGKFGGRIVTRFPPEPNGYLHIGHAKSICLNFGIAQEHAGASCHLRFDDTNPETEDIRYVEAAIEDVKWLGFDWGEHLYFASDYFEEFYRLAEGLIGEGKAYVDSLDEEEIRAYRGTITEPGRESPYRNRSVEENLDLLRRMRAGEFPDGAHVLRAKGDMGSRNMLMRDPLLYRIRHASHYRQGDAWCIYPLYDYAHPIEDALECVTHSLCTLEFENNRELYDWIVENTALACRPEQTEFARLSLDYTVVSKRRLLELVRGGHVSGWDDPRMPTIAGLRRRGVTPEAIRNFCDMLGVTKANSRVDIAKLEFAVRDDLNRRVPRVLCVLRPLRVVIVNYPEGESEWVDAPLYPHDVPLEGTRAIPFSRVLYIDREDFREDPPKGYFRLAPGREVRLRYGYLIQCVDVVKNASGEVIELHCTYDPETLGGAAPDGRVVRGTLHWVSAEHALSAEVRLYDRLFTVPDPGAAGDGEERDFRAFLNPESLVVLHDARIEPSVRVDAPGTRYQFERTGYFVSDTVDSSSERLVFNRTVTLRDTWAKVSGEGVVDHGRPRELRASSNAGARAGAGGGEHAGAPGGVVDTTARAVAGTAGRVATETAERPPELEAKRRRWVSELGLGEEEADILTRDAPTAALFETAIAAHPNARSLANWIIHELPRAQADREDEPLPFGGGELAALVALIDEGAVSSTAAREVLAEMMVQGGDPRAIVERKGLRQVSDAGTLAPLVDDVLAAHPNKAIEYRAGRTGLLGFFMGQVMAKAGGRANPEILRALLEERLNRPPRDS